MNQKPPTISLRFLSLLRLQRLLPVAPDHDEGEEGAHDGSAQEDEDYWDADGPFAGWEERMERVAVVDEGLGFVRLVDTWEWKFGGRATTISKVQMV